MFKKIHYVSTYLALDPPVPCGTMASWFRHITRSAAASVFASSQVVHRLCRSSFRVDLHVFLDLPLPLLPPVGIHGITSAALWCRANNVSRELSLLSATLTCSRLWFVLVCISAFVILSFQVSPRICINSFDETHLIYYVSILYFSTFRLHRYPLILLLLNTVAVWSSGSRNWMSTYFLVF